MTLAVALLSPAAASEITTIPIDDGAISSVAIAPGGNGVAVGVYGSGEMPGDQATVHWWNRNGTMGSRALPTQRINALTWDKDGSLLMGERVEVRVPAQRWWRLGPDGAILTACEATPPYDGSIHTLAHGIHSIAVLPDGKVVTGGVDATLAVWEGCKATWLHSGPCCYTDQDVTVTARGDGFVTVGEAIWRGEERGYEQLGPRRWSPGPWRAVPLEPRPAPVGLWADGENCSATLGPDGHLTVQGALSWEASFGEDKWQLLATSRDCTAVAAATERRLVWTKAP